MEDKLRLNNRLLGFAGVISRHDFFLNTIIIKLILFLFTPVYAWISMHILTVKDIIYFTDFLKNSPLWVIIALAVNFFVEFIFIFSNYTRRINDIRGKAGKFPNFLVFLFLLITAISFFISPVLYLIFSIFGGILYLFLLIKSGKVTSRYPYDFTKEFNWGAFFGGWLWGLCNKSYLPLLNIIFWFTPLSFILSLIWGLKGNEWAYKNKKFNDVEKFNNSQRNQTFFFIAFAIFTRVIFAVVLFFVLIFSIAYLDNKSESKDSGKIDNIIESIVSNYFETYKIEEDKNTFIMDINDWKKYSFKNRVDIIDGAASIAVMEKRDKNKEKYYYKTEELNKTKIYDSKCNLLLAEFKLDVDDNASFKDFLKASLDAYKFYNPVCNK